jgi:hypothetical protein
VEGYSEVGAGPARSSGRTFSSISLCARKRHQTPERGGMLPPG